MVWLHADLLLHLFNIFFITFFLSYFFFSFSFPLWFIGLLHRFFIFCVCGFGQTLTIAQFHTTYISM